MDDTSIRRASVAGALSPALFVFLVLLMGLLHPAYSHLTNFISDLGALDAPNPYVQRANFLQFGTGIALHAVALYQRTDRSSRTAFTLQLVIALGIFLSGFFPGHANDPASRASMLHNLVGIPAFLMIMLVPTIAGLQFRKIEQWRSLALPSIAMTPALIAFFFLMAWADGAPNGCHFSPG